MRGVRGVAVFACAFVALVVASSAPGATRAGALSFDGTWEGADPTRGWDGIHVSFGGGSYNFVSDPARRGTVARITLPAGGEAAVEAIHHRLLQLGETTVYGLAFKFPDGWRKPTDGWGCLIAQFAYPLLKYTNIGLGVGANYVGLEMHTGRIDWQGRTPSAGNPASFDLYMPSRDPRGYVIPPARFATGVWHLLLIEVKWATDKTGSLRAWHQRQGDSTWTKTVDLQGIPTMQWGQGITGAYMGADGKDRQGAPKEISDKLGAYRDASPYQLTMYNDGMVIGSTPEVVADRVNGTPFHAVLTGPRLGPARVGKPYRELLSTLGGVRPFLWSVSRGELPRGIALDRRTGRLSGRPRASGRFGFVVRLTDGAGGSAERWFSLRVRS